MKVDGHFKVSMVKSFLRICGCGFLFVQSFAISAILFFIAEVLGVLEEFTET